MPNNNIDTIEQLVNQEDYISAFDLIDTLRLEHDSQLPYPKG